MAIEKENVKQVLHLYDYKLWLFSCSLAKWVYESSMNIFQSFIAGCSLKCYRKTLQQKFTTPSLGVILQFPNHPYVQRAFFIALRGVFLDKTDMLITVDGSSPITSWQVEVVYILYILPSFSYIPSWSMIFSAFTPCLQKYMPNFIFFVTRPRNWPIST